MRNDFDHIKTIFIGGCPRSGTTMLGSILGSARDCIVTPESQFKQIIPASLCSDLDKGIDRSAFFSVLKNNFRFKLWNISAPEINLPDLLKTTDYRSALLSLVDCYARKVRKENWHFWIDHTPLNIQKPIILMKTFPEAKFIHIVRDPRAVAASILPLNWGPHSALHAALFWAQRISCGQALERAYPDKCIRVYYEDILSFSEKTIREVCAFCGIQYEENMLSGEGFRIPDYTKKQHELVGSKPDIARLDAWKESLDIWQVAKIEETIGDLMELMGYKKYFADKLPRPSLVRKLKQKIKSLPLYLNKKLRFKRVLNIH